MDAFNNLDVDAAFDDLENEMEVAANSAPDAQRSEMDVDQAPGIQAPSAGAAPAPPAPEASQQEPPQAPGIQDPPAGAASAAPAPEAKQQDVPPPATSTAAQPDAAAGAPLRKPATFSRKPLAAMKAKAPTSAPSANTPPIANTPAAAPAESAATAAGSTDLDPSNAPTGDLPKASADPSTSASPADTPAQKAVPKPRARKLALEPKKTQASTSAGPPDPSKPPAKVKKVSEKKEKKVSEKKEKKTKMPRATSAYQFWCSSASGRSKLKADEPELTFGEQGSRLGDIWKQMTEVEKAEFVDLNIKDQARVKQELKDLGIEKPAPKPRAPRAKKAPSKVEPAEDDEQDDDEDEVEAGDPSADAEVPEGKSEGKSGGKPGARRSKKTASKGEDSDDEAARENCDWEANGASGIVCATNGKYVVKRKGLPFSEYGLVDVQAAKRQRVDGDGKSCPLPLAMVNDFEGLHRTFWHEANRHSSGGHLDLDEIADDSPLEMCSFLGQMREGYLAKVVRGRAAEPDVAMSVPLMRTCFVVQALLQCERNVTKDLRAQLKAKDQIIQDLQSADKEA